MKVYTRSEAKHDLFRITNNIHSGQIFLYPTDTIYGIGCNALDDSAVSKVRQAKQSGDRPYAVIAPSKEWIHENCHVTKKAEEWLNKLPGPYTLVFKTKNKAVVSKHVNPKDDGTIAIRMPNHWIQKLVEELGVPIITPPANVTGKNFMTSLDDLDSELKNVSHFAVYEGEKKGKPSEIIYLDK